MLEIVYKRLDELKAYSNNPRNIKKAIEPVMESIKLYGFRVPIIIDNNNVIVAGHTRFEASKRLGLDKVPCLTKENLDEKQIKAFRIIDNKTQEFAEWDKELLKIEMQDLKIDQDLFKIKIELEELDKVEEDNFNLKISKEAPDIKVGDLYKLGDHILMCGDSTNLEHVKKLCEQAKQIDLVVTDPPYNVNYGEKGKVINSYGYQFSDRKILNDFMPKKEFLNFLKDAFHCMNEVLKPDGSFYIFHVSSTVLEFEMALRENKLETRQQLIWVKNSLVLGRQEYQWIHEPCLYGWKDGKSHYFSYDRTNTTVIDDTSDIKKMNKEEMKNLLLKIYSDRLPTTVIREDKPNRSVEHPTMKPIKLIVKLVINSSKQNENVLDLFGGSGSTLIACEQLKRNCYIMKLDPKYVEVIIKRWEKITGLKAERINENKDG